MGDVKHTAGPWEWVEDRANGGFSGLVGPDGSEVLFPNTRNEGDTGAAWFEDFPSEANARLIASAPDLVLALAEIAAKATLAADACDNEGRASGFRILAADARAAIAKATGEQA